MSQPTFEIQNRTCKVGGHVNVRTQKHGVEEVVTALDFTVLYQLEREEVNVLTNDTEGYDRLFRQEGEKLEPALKSCRPLKDQIESAHVEIVVSDGSKALILGDCKVSKIRFEPKTKGACNVRSQIQCTPKLDVGVTNLLRNLGTEQAKISIRAQNEQQALELNEGEGEGKKPEKGKRGGKKTSEPAAPDTNVTQFPGKRTRKKKTNGHAEQSEQPPAS